MLIAQLPGAIGSQPPQADQHPGKELIGETLTQLPGLLAVDPTEALQESPGVLAPGPVIPQLPGALGLKPPQAHQHLVRNRLVQLVANLPGVFRIAAPNCQGDLLGSHIRELQPQLAGAGVFPHPRKAAGNKYGHLIFELFTKIHRLFGTQAAQALGNHARLPVLDPGPKSMRFRSIKSGGEESGKAGGALTKPVELRIEMIGQGNPPPLFIISLADLKSAGSELAQRLFFRAELCPARIRYFRVSLPRQDILDTVEDSLQ